MTHNHDDSTSGADLASQARRRALCQIIERWQIHREVYSEITHFKCPRWALYGMLPTGERIILAVFGEKVRVEYAQDVIDLYLQDEQPETAANLVHDLNSLIVSLKNLEECEEIIPYRPHEQIDKPTSHEADQKARRKAGS
ncbi:MAG TPA: hypothetical protein PLZ57_11210 [Pseudobdellovibrionaceae bacterium]|nr:hypothetical protein [Pseudobdellovibrionaceae bacterium]